MTIAARMHRITRRQAWILARPWVWAVALAVTAAVVIIIELAIRVLPW